MWNSSLCVAIGVVMGRHSIATAFLDSGGEEFCVGFRVL